MLQNGIIKQQRHMPPAMLSYQDADSIRVLLIGSALGPGWLSTPHRRLTSEDQQGTCEAALRPSERPRPVPEVPQRYAEVSPRFFARQSGSFKEPSRLSENPGRWFESPSQSETGNKLSFAVEALLGRRTRP